MRIDGDIAGSLTGDGAIGVSVEGGGDLHDGRQVEPDIAACTSGCGSDVLIHSDDEVVSVDEGEVGFDPPGLSESLVPETIEEVIVS